MKVARRCAPNACLVNSPLELKLPQTRSLLKLLVFSACAAAWWLAGLYLYLSPNLPDARTIRSISLQTPMRVLSRDGQLIGQFGEQKRYPLRFDDIPQSFINALLAAEDDAFFSHGGIDFGGLARAVSELVMTGRKGSGGSTITMQVARNYFLTLDQTFIRKFNELLLTIEIERALTKEEIFELYVNRIFLGHRSYGFEAAAQTYYGKSLSELNLAQHAMLAGVPQAPSRNNPISRPETSKKRRNWIISRMARLGMIDETQRAAAAASPVTAQRHGLRVEVNADYVAEMVRQEMVRRFGNAAYNDGYVVFTSVDASLQSAARESLIGGLMTYDRRHGWRGPERQLPPNDAETAEETTAKWEAALRAMPIIAGLPPAIVTAIDENGADVVDREGVTHRLDWQGDLAKIRRFVNENRTAAPKKSPIALLSVGDLIRLSANSSGSVRLAQVPRAQSALVSLDPSNGAIRALVGGMGFELSKFNRATQARRQPGSNFKPFLYAAAIDKGLTAASLINDAPIVLDNLDNDEIWRPENDSGKFYGPTRLREALTFSRNLVSIRVLQNLGVDTFINYIDTLGFDTSGMSRNLTLALGTHAFTPMEVATGYAILANGGYRVEPWLIERIENAQGEVVYEADPLVACSGCDPDHEESSDELPTRMEDILASAETKQHSSAAPQVMDKRVSFVVSSMLQDAIQRGTGRRARVLNRGDIAGKTGTTNGPRDAWFSGYNDQLVTTAWVGFDDYSLLGRREFGGTAALPIWIDFMRQALNKEQSHAPMPQGVVRLRIDRESGQRVAGTPPNTMLEYFLEEFLPEQAEQTDTPIGTDDLDSLF